MPVFGVRGVGGARRPVPGEMPSHLVDASHQGPPTNKGTITTRATFTPVTCIGQALSRGFS